MQPHDGGWVNGRSGLVTMVHHSPAVGPQAHEEGFCCLRHTGSFAIALMQIPKIGIGHDGVILGQHTMHQTLTPNQERLFEEARQIIVRLLRELGEDPDGWLIL